jgi:hypothetical protein
VVVSGGCGVGRNAMTCGRGRRVGRRIRKRKTEKKRKMKELIWRNVGPCDEKRKTKQKNT